MAAGSATTQAHNSLHHAFSRLADQPIAAWEAAAAAMTGKEREHAEIAIAARRAVEGARSPPAG